MTSLLARSLRLSVLSCSTLASSAYAVSGSYAILGSFVDPFGIAEVQQLDFGDLVANAATTYTLDTSNNFSAGSGGALVGGTPLSGQFTLTDSGGSAGVDIRVVNLTADNGVTPSTAKCRYDVNPESGGCTLLNQTNPGAGGKTLYVGMTITTDGTQGNGANAAPSFDIDITYN